MSVLLPQLNSIRTKMDAVNAFYGYDHNLRIKDTSFFDMQNMTGRYSPVIASRGKRMKLRTISKPNGLFAHNHLCWVDGTAFYYNGQQRGTVTDSEKQFVKMGAYVIIWPDAAYYNTHTNEFGMLGAKTVTTGQVTAKLCRIDGELYDSYPVSDTQPESPENGDLWLDTSTTPNVLRQYSALTNVWNAIPTVYTKIEATGIGAAFEEHDGVTISGFTEDESLNGNFYLVDSGDNYIIIVALIQNAVSQSGAVTVERKIPQMDFICESGNRLFGCSSENHEIYASALGSPQNWNRFEETESDSYAATVGTAGPFTGAIAHQNNVIFLKEHCIHILMGTKPSNFQLETVECRGVESGSERSMCHINEVLFYKSVEDVCMYGASFPSKISRALGQHKYKNAVGGALGRLYYLCMRNESDESVVFVYDTESDFWVKEDSEDIRWFAALGNELYFLNEKGELWSVNGSGKEEYGDATAEKEKDVAWMIETGDIGYEAPYNKYISGIQLYAEGEIGHTVRISIRYDNRMQPWTEVFQFTPAMRKSMVLPIVPRRCRIMNIRIHGTGPFKLFSIAKRVEEGSDVYAT